ncbi:hypothetical protein EDD11_010348 [Mortierella claussenii]|nr:hypothetical protein EDD11_010348 [Mortierella claussenii]
MTARKASKKRFSTQDIESILTWLEHPPNFISIFGCGGQTDVGKSKRTPSQGYAVLAQIVTKQSKGRFNLNKKNMRARFGRHMKAYIDARTKAQSMGFDAIDKDRRNGTSTMARKLENMCTCYARMDALFRHRSNVTLMDEYFASRRPVQRQVVQEGNEDQEHNTTPRPRRRLIVDEEDEADYEETQDFQHNECLEINNYTQDDNEGSVIDNIFDGGLDSSLSDIGDDMEEGHAAGTNNNNNTLDNNETSELSISLLPVLQCQQKRQLTDTESQSES